MANQIRALEAQAYSASLSQASVSPRGEFIPAKSLAKGYIAYQEEHRFRNKTTYCPLKFSRIKDEH